MIVTVKTRKPISWPGNEWEFGCRHRRYESGRGQLEIHIPTRPGSYTRGRRIVRACLGCALSEFLKAPNLDLAETRDSEPFRIHEDSKDGAVISVARQRLADRGTTTVYWVEE